MNTPANNDLVARAAAAALDPAASQQQPQQPAAPNQNSSEPDTTVGNAEAQGSPKTEADQMAADAIIYEITRPDGSKKNLTPAQINSMMDRYSSLNFTHSQMKPVLDVVAAYIKSNPNENPGTVAKKLLDLARANQPNAQFGARAEQAQDTNSASAPVDPEALKKWAEDNAVALPPGYEQMLMANQQSQQTMQQIMRGMTALLAQSRGMTEAAATANRGVNQDRAGLMRSQIGQNLDRVQQHLGLPDETANDFMMFAAERGYTEADFLDIQLTAKVMNDFKNALQGPEMQRIRDIAQRRQAFTAAGVGGVPAAPGGGSSSPETPLERLTNAILERKMGA